MFRVIGLVQSRQISTSSLMYEIASMMEESVTDAGSCGRGCCVELESANGAAESRLLQLDESVSPEDNDCIKYTCKVSRISKELSSS